MSEVTDMTKKELFSSLNEYVDEINKLVLEAEERYKLLWESYEELDEDHRRLGYKNLELKEENEVLKQEESETQKAYDLGYEEGFAKGEQSVWEKINKICEFWEKNSAQNIEAALGEAVTLREMLSNINESYNKIIDYETRMKKEIEVGDEVENENGNKYIVIEIDKAGREARMINRRMMCIIGIKHLTKTGKHYPIDEMLRGLEE